MARARLARRSIPPSGRGGDRMAGRACRGTSGVRLRGPVRDTIRTRDDPDVHTCPIRAWSSGARSSRSGLYSKECCATRRAARLGRRPSGGQRDVKVPTCPLFRLRWRPVDPLPRLSWFRRRFPPRQARSKAPARALSDADSDPPRVRDAGRPATACLVCAVRLRRLVYGDTVGRSVAEKESCHLRNA